MAGAESGKKSRPGPWPPVPAEMPASSWAKRTGFRPRLSGETNASNYGHVAIRPQDQPLARAGEACLDLEAGGIRAAEREEQAERDRRARKGRGSGGSGGGHKRVGINEQVVGAAGTEEPASRAGGGHQRQSSRRSLRSEEAVDVLPQSVEDDGFPRHSHLKYELRDSPGFVPIGFYGLQHYLSILGSLVLTPLVIVPAMGGTYEDTSNVVSTVLFVSGVSTLLHTFFGSRLPLIQGPSFVYLAPALAIIHSPEFLRLNGNNFRHIMKELQGAIIIASSFQAILGYSGLMKIFLKWINPVVVAPTVASIGLSFYSYGFPRVGACLEIGAVQILLVIIFSLYLRKVAILGHRAFLIYAVPLSLAMTWIVAYFLTELGTYNYTGCDVNVPASKIISAHCRRHVSRMKSCRVDTSHALRASPWIRFPYPLQWGLPIFHWKMALVMCVVTIISSVDSVGSYHASSLLVASRPPTPGVLSRGIGLEGLTSLLAGLWGTGTGSTTLTENVHTIAVTKMGSRSAVSFGAVALIILSLVGKVGGFIASIPEVIVAALLSFMWAMLAALGLSNLRYSKAGSSRNIIIVGLSLFFSLTIPAYFQDYGISPNSKLSVPSYFQPYVVASHGPIHTKYGGLNYLLNTLFSLHMVIAFLVAVILDNTVPGSSQERGVYTWSEPEAATREPAIVKDYRLPFRVGKLFRWVKWVGL